MFKSFVIIVLFVGHSYGREVKSIPLSKVNNNFGVKLLHHLGDDQKNIFFSPFSISIAFAILYPGAKGRTAEEMSEGLGYKSAKLSDKQISEQFSEVLNEMVDKKSNTFDLFLANRIIAQKDSEIVETFKNNIQKYFKSNIELMDFSADPLTLTKGINEWVAKQTKNKIKEIVNKPLDSMTRMLILNAIYFKGVFQTKFDKHLTREEVFFNGGQTEQPIKMMKRVGKFNLTEIEEIDSKLLEIPYSGDDMSLYILLPNERNGLKDLMNNLKDFSIVEQNIGQLREVEAFVWIPKFKIETTSQLNKKLPEMGIKSLFTKSADLSAINGHKNLFVSEAIHKAYVEVSEEGTEAAAATVIRVQAKSMAFGRIYFRADHPFIFFIRNNENGLILFLGQINKL